MLNMSNLRQRETAALHAASDAKYVQDWGFYMKCYAEGRFNVSNPPEPPPRCFSFSYLTAPTPQDEVRRLEAVKRVDVFYPSSTIETAEHLILLARKIFQVNGSALSFLERDSEIMRVECGYGQRLISRQDSIAAHVLLAGGEPMVILDAQKDWRVNGNPLVQGPPYIRFFAVAPLVTLEGYIIGAFAVFDTEPREHFSVRSRRSLVDFTKIAMTDIEEVSAEHPALRQQVFTPEPSKGTGEHVNYPRAGSKRRSITRLLNDFEQEARGKDEDEMRWVSSRPDYSDTKEVEKHSPSTTKTSIFEGNSFSTFAEVYAAESQHGRNASGGTEEASRSTVNAMQKRKGRLSVPTPPDTPLNGINPHSPETVFRARSDSPTLPFHGPPKSIRHNVREDANVFTDEAPALGTSGLLGSSVLGRNGDSEELKPARNLEEAEKILDAVADELKFDFVYLLALQPYPPAHYGDIPRDHDETHACHLFAAHGLPDPMPEFAPGLHLNALQQAGGMVYINGVEPSSQDDDVAFCMGVLVPVVRYQTLGRSPPQPNLEEDLNCQGGALLAAYKKHNPKEIDSEDIFDAMRYAARLLKTFAQDPFET
ncbi:MAG: hypothetical protein M1817_002419 [Caeruleum heppii]|nr:MAG: hypothetical protein M1817_002419 [Caeruleum heppii]